MLYPTDERPAGEQSTTLDRHDAAVLEEPAMAAAVRSLRALIMAGERYRLTVAARLGLGTTEMQALSYLAVHGDRGQSELARDLSLTSSAATALVDRLERHGAAERARHPTDRRRTTIRLTTRGEQLVADSQGPLLASLKQVDPAALPHLADWLDAIAGSLHARTS